MELAASTTAGARRLLALSIGSAVAGLSLFAGTAAQAAEGLSGAAADAGSGQKPSRLGAECSVPAAATSAKVIVVEGTGGSTASVTACQRWAGDYYAAISADGHVGFNGIAAAGEKAEGDGKTPSGIYSMGYGFGVEDRPKQFHGSTYVTVTEDDVWVDGDATKDYNTMQKKSEGYEGEAMHQSPAYDYGQVIDYNPEGTPGKGSAIFLHVNTGSGETAGCVSVPQKDLLDLFDWEGDSEVEMAISGAGAATA